MFPDDPWKNRLPLGDEQYTLILNADCPPEHCTEDLRAFYAYLKDGVVDEKDDLIREIHHQVEHANQEEGVLHFMTLQEELDIRDLIIEKKDKEAKEANRKAEEAKAEAEVLRRKLREAEEKLRQNMG